MLERLIKDPPFWALQDRLPPTTKRLFASGKRFALQLRNLSVGESTEDARALHIVADAIERDPITEHQAHLDDPEDHEEQQRCRDRGLDHHRASLASPAGTHPAHPLGGTKTVVVVVGAAVVGVVVLLATQQSAGGGIPEAKPVLWRSRPDTRDTGDPWGSSIVVVTVIILFITAINDGVRSSRT